MNITSYKKYLSSRGTTLGQVKRTQSDVVMNNTFTLDPTYKKVYILGKEHFSDGTIAEEFSWHFVDAKYQTHSAPSIAKDAVDYYLQFRPKVHYPIGTYVIVPDDTSPNINLEGEEQFSNPFLQPIEKRTQIWIIVGRDEAPAYVRYMILKCNWDYRWVYDGKVRHCWGCARNSSSYTAGVWRDDLSSSLDDLNAVWMPDTHYVYGDKLESFGMDDTRTITYGQRFMLTNNVLDPKIFEVTKIIELSPQGVIKYSIKQDSFNEKRDNIELRVCDYYSDSGEVQIDKPIIEEPNPDVTPIITWLYLDENDGYLYEYENQTENTVVYYGKKTYYKISIDGKNLSWQWRVELIDENGEFSDKKSYYENLITVDSLDSSTVSIKAGKAGSLVGKKFKLYATDTTDTYEKYIEVEVVK